MHRDSECHSAVSVGTACCHDWIGRRTELYDSSNIVFNDLDSLAMCHTNVALSECKLLYCFRTRGREHVQDVESIPKLGTQPH
jgi:hypothetical protein